MPARTRVSVKEKPRVEPPLPKDPIEEVAEELHGHVKVRLRAKPYIDLLTYTL